MQPRLFDGVVTLYNARLKASETADGLGHAHTQRRTDGLTDRQTERYASINILQVKVGRFVNILFGLVSVCKRFAGSPFIFCTLSHTECAKSRLPGLCGRIETHPVRCHTAAITLWVGFLIRISTLRQSLFHCNRAALRLLGKWEPFCSQDLFHLSRRGKRKGVAHRESLLEAG